MKAHPVENLLRDPVEIYTAITALSCALTIYMKPGLFLLTDAMANITCYALVVFGLYRGLCGYIVKKYQNRLKALPLYALKTTQIPASKKYLFLGKGFKWMPHHTQRLAQIKEVKNEHYTQHSKFYQAVRDFAIKHEGSMIARWLNNPSIINPFRPMPDLGGSSFLHGVGNKDKPIFIPQKERNTHTLVMGTTGVGKTRTADILINQDIRNADSAVIVVDPKGDLDLVKSMYAACVASGREDDFRVVHLGFPEMSACYNPLKNFDNITEVATRITDAINAEGEGKQFADFAWKYVDIVAKSLETIELEINYENISFYISRLDVLLQIYADKIMPELQSNYRVSVQTIIDEHDCKVDKSGAPVQPIGRTKAVIKYLKDFIEKRLKDNQTSDIKPLISLFEAAIMDKTYYDKITASVGPVLAKINGSNASRIFSFKDKSQEVELMEVIKNKKILYIGLNSLSNFEVAQAVGKAFLSDLVSIAGKIYNDTSGEKYILNLHVDELSEVIQDSFVKILNKARGAGFMVTAYSQTKQDLEVALGSKAKAEMAKGNFSNIIMMRVKNEETAKMLIDTLKQVNIVTHTQVSMVTDTPHGENSTYFNTNNEDRVQMTSVDMLSVSDIAELPTGQAFAKIGGNTLYKIRIPIAKDDGLAPKDIESCIKKINKITDEVTIVSNRCDEVENRSSDVSPETLVEPAQVEKVYSKPLIHEVETQQTEVTNDSTCEGNEEKNSLHPESTIKHHLEAPTENDAIQPVVTAFTHWLQSRIESKNRQFSLESQKLVFCNQDTYGDSTVFILPGVLVKYQSREGIQAQQMTEHLTTVYESKKSFFIKISGEKVAVLPVKLNSGVQSSKNTEIMEGI